MILTRAWAKDHHGLETMTPTHDEALEMYESGWDADRENRDDGQDDLRFLAGDQWDVRAKAERELARRPVVTINRMGQFVRQVTGDMRLNPTSINVVPVDDTDDEKAETFAGIIRMIEHSSMAQNVYANAFEAQAGVGIGHFRVNTKYAADSVFEQEIIIQRILNPFSVVWDPNANEIDRSDAKWCFVTELMSKAAFEKKYPGKNQEDFPRAINGTSNLYWQDGEFIRVCEFWYREPYKRTLVMTEQGETIDATGLSKAERAVLGGIAERTFEDYKVKQCLMSGAEFLTGWRDWAGKHIPIIPAIGTEIPLDEKVVRHGIVRWAKDPQRLYNYYRSSSAELIGQQPRAPFLVTPEMIKGWEAQWNTANTNPRPYLPYNPDSSAPNARPERVQPPQASAALWQEAQIAQDDMKATTGIYDASLGAKSNETSGVAIQARQQEGDVGSYQYFDNFKCAIKRAGDILIDLIPKIYDTQRVLRIIGKEDETESVTVNQRVSDGSGVEQVLNDLSVGRFDVRVTSGPAFSTMRQAAQEGMIAAAQAYPMLWEKAGDLIVGAMQWPKAAAISERLKRTMPPELTATKEELEQMQNQPQTPPPPDPIQMEAERKMALDQGRLEIEASKVQIEAAKVEADIEIQHKKLGIDAAKFEADYDMKAEQANNQSIKDDRQFERDGMPENEPGEVETSDRADIIEAIEQFAEMLSVQQSESNAALAMAITEAMSKPKTVTTPDGRTYEMRVG